LRKAAASACLRKGCSFSGSSFAFTSKPLTTRYRHTFHRLFRPLPFCSILKNLSTVFLPGIRSRSAKRKGRAAARLLARSGTYLVRDQLCESGESTGRLIVRGPSLLGICTFCIHALFAVSGCAAGNLNAAIHAPREPRQPRGYDLASFTSRTCLRGPSQLVAPAAVKGIEVSMWPP
jgi:hypothetical protein